MKVMIDWVAVLMAAVSSLICAEFPYILPHFAIFLRHNTLHCGITSNEQRNPILFFLRQIGK